MTRPAKTKRAGLPALVAETPLVPQPPALVLFGRDGGGRPRAAWFDTADAEAAATAAKTMRLHALSLADDAGRDLVGQLARGRVLPSGRALVPFAKRDLYAQLVTLAGEEAGLAVAAGDRTDPPSAVDAPVTDPPVELDAPATEDAATPAASGDERPSGDGKVAVPIASAPADTPPPPRPGAHLFVGQPHPEDRAEIGLDVWSRGVV